MLTLGNGIPVAEFSKAIISREARSCARSSNSPLYSGGTTSPNGLSGSVIKRWADNNPARTLI